MSDDLQEILDRDPRSYTRSERDEIVRMYRSRRYNFNAAPKARAKKPVSGEKQEILSLAEALKGSIDL